MTRTSHLEEGIMKAWSRHRWHRRPVTFAVLGLSCLAVSAFAGGGPVSGLDVPFTVPRAVCGPNDHPESALQGQVPAYLRAAGFQGFNCNLQLIGQSRGDGANWQSAEFKDSAGHTCAYHGTAFTTANRTNLGAPVIDVTNPANPTPTGYLTSISMLDPWESLKVNATRKLLAADNAHNGAGGPEVDIYDVSGDCRTPQLLASVAVGTGTDGGEVAPVIGHEGSWAPDGLTYYGGSPRQRIYYAVDTVDPTAPKLISTFTNPLPGGLTHGLSISDDGNRAYLTTLSIPAATDVGNPNFVPTNGLMIVDVSDIQARKPNPQWRIISTLVYVDGSVGWRRHARRLAGRLRRRPSAISHGPDHRHQR